VYAGVGAVIGFALAFFFTMFTLRFGGDIGLLLMVSAGVIGVFALAGWLVGEKVLEWLEEWPFQRW
jgi:hypothetical protein